MKSTIRMIVERVLPARLAAIVVAVGQAVRKAVRTSARFLRFNFGRTVVVDVAVDDVTFSVVTNPYRNGAVDEMLARDGAYEPEMSAALRSSIKPEAVFVDIGANIGYYSLLVAAALRGTGAVHAFEPQPNLCALVNDSVRRNGFSNVTVYNMGLGDHEAQLPMYIRSENVGGSSFMDYRSMPDFKVSDRTVPLRIARLDDLLEGRVDVIKIDVEGYEFEALLGAKRLLETYHPVVFMEFSPMFYEVNRAGKSAELLSYLTGLGYAFRSIDGTALHVSDLLADGVQQVNIVCVA